MAHATGIYNTDLSRKISVASNNSRPRLAVKMEERDHEKGLLDGNMCDPTLQICFEL